MEQVHLASRISRHLQQIPDKVAVVCGSKSVTYLQLQTESGKLANFFHDQVKTVKYILIMLDRSPEMVISILAILRCGLIFVPIDPGCPGGRIQTLFKEVGAEWLITTTAYKEKFKDIIAAENLNILLMDDKTKAWDSCNTTFKDIYSQHCYIYFTSGSSGVPKGVLGRHRSLLHFVDWEIREFALNEYTRVSQLTNPSFDQILRDIFVPLEVGGTCCIPENRDILLNPEQLLKWLDKNRVTLIHMVPSYFKALSQAVKNADCLFYVKYILLAGELIRGNDIKEFIEIFRNRIQLVNFYGPTETTLIKSFYRINETDINRAVIPAGRPIADTQIMILDKSLKKCLVQNVGEVYIRTPYISSGYFNSRELTRQVFIKNPFSDNIRDIIYKTGDLGRINHEGNLELIGRVDSQVKIRGIRVELGEIEDLLLSYNGISEAIVLTDEDEQGNKYLIAYLVVERNFTISELRRYLAKNLPENMIPSQFRRIDKVPLSPNGKVDRQALLAAKHESLEMETTFVAPKKGLEKIIADAWKEVLKVDKIGIYDNFFELGANSMHLIAVNSKIKEFLKKDIPVVALLANPTVNELTRYLQEESIVTGKTEIARMNPKAQKGGIAIIGMAGRFPGAENIEAFWENLKNGVESISYFTDQELEGGEVDPRLLKNPNYVKARAVLEDSSYFDAFFFNYSPKEAEIMDPQLRILHECAWEALEDAGYNPDNYDGLIGCYSGASSNVYWLKRFLIQGGNFSTADRFNVYTLNSFSSYGTRIAYKLNLRGPGFPIHTGCSTSLVNIHLACQGLLNGDCDIALAGGVSLAYPPKSGYIHQEGMMHSPDGHTRAFDVLAQGTVFGDGVGMVVLKPLEDALADGDTIYAFIKGSAINNDGNRRLGYTAPSTQGQAEVIRAAMLAAGIDAECISYVETHGTGTTLGDPNEIEGLKRAFNTDKKGFCKIATLKTNVGHLDVAAGVAGVIKTVLSLKHRLIPPNLHFIKPNPEIDFSDSPFVVNTTLSQWKRRENHEPLRAGVSSFGIGGTNAHVVLEESPIAQSAERQALSAGREYHLILLSARSESALDKMTENLMEYFKKIILNPGNHVNPINPGLILADVAYTLQVGRKAFNHRRMLVCSDVNEAIENLSHKNPEKVHSHSLDEGEGDRKVVFMFSGQGAQYVNMGLELYQTESFFREEMDRCFEILKPLMGYDIKEILYPNPDCRGGSPCPPKNCVGTPDQCDHRGPPLQSDRINQTEIAQPLLFVFEYALSKLLMKWRIKPYAMIGHSIGEYVAACLAGVFSLEDALSLVVSRGQLMQQIPGGSMLGVPMPEKELTPLLNDEIALAAVNSSTNCVLSGTIAAIDTIEKQLEQKGIKTSRLHTSHAFHSMMMDSILNRFEQRVKSIPANEPQMPYISNLSGNWITVEQAVDPGYWSKHIRQTVRFAKGIEVLLKEKNTLFIEVGPGRTLAALVKKIIGDQQKQRVVNLVRHPREMVSDLFYLENALGWLWIWGVKLEWQEYHANEKRYRISLPTYPFERQFYWVKDHTVELTGANLENQRQVITSLPRKNPDISNWFYVPSWKRLNLKPVSSSVGDALFRWLFFSEKSGFDFKLIDGLVREGHEVITVKPGAGFTRENNHSYIINPANPEDYETLIAELLLSPTFPTKIVHMWNIDEKGAKETGLEDFFNIQDRGFFSILYLAQAIGKHGFDHDFHITILTTRMLDVMGKDQVYPGKTTLLGAIRVIPQEYPNLRCRGIDIDLPKPGSWQEKKIVERLVAEFKNESREPVVAYRGDLLLVPTVEPIQLEGNEQEKIKLKQGGVYLITGGMGNIGLHVAEYLAKNWNTTLILTGRSPFPHQDEWDTWLTAHGPDDRTSRKIIKVKEIKNFTANLMIVQADVTSLQEMESLITEAEKRFGKLDGLLHAAGIAGEESMKTIKEMDREKCYQLFKPKINGLLVLEKILEGKDLDFCLLFSSISSILGGIGLMAYSAANIFMDSFARRQNHKIHFPWITIDWDLWRFEEQKNMMNNPGGPGANLLELSMEPGEGIEALKRILSQEDVQQVIVSTGELSTRIKQWIDGESLRDTHDIKEQESSINVKSRPGLSNSYTAPGNNLERMIADLWEDYFGIKGIGIHDNFFDLGATSLDLIRLNDRLKKRFKKDLPIEKLFSYPTISALAKHLHQNQIGLDKGLCDEEIERVEIVVKGKDRLKRRKISMKGTHNG